jgi:hypothetical protein
MAKQTFTTGQVLTAAQMTSLQQTAMGGGSTTAKTTSYVLVAADAGTVVQMNAAGATTITVNTALFAAGDTVQIQNIGAGVCTVTAGTATVSTAGSLALSQYETGELYFTSTSAALFTDYTQASAAGGGMTLLSTTTLSGAGTTISGISQDYINLQIFLIGVNAATDGYYLECNLNSVANLTDQNAFSPSSTGSAKTYDNANAIPYEFTFNTAMLNNETNNSFNLTVLNYASATSYKAMYGSADFLTTSSVRKFENTSAYFRSATAVSSIQFRMHGGGVTTNFNGGTVLIYGVK